MTDNQANHDDPDDPAEEGGLTLKKRSKYIRPVVRRPVYLCRQIEILPKGGTASSRYWQEVDGLLYLLAQLQVALDRDIGQALVDHGEGKIDLERFDALVAAIQRRLPGRANDDDMEPE